MILRPRRGVPERAIGPGQGSPGFALASPQTARRHRGRAGPGGEPACCLGRLPYRWLLRSAAGDDRRRVAPPGRSRARQRASSGIRCVAASTKQDTASLPRRVRSAQPLRSHVRRCARDRESTRPRAPETRPSPRHRRDPARGRLSAPDRRPLPRRARCHARRSKSDSGSVSSAGARWISWRSAAAARPMAEPPSGCRNFTWCQTVISSAGSPHAMPSRRCPVARPRAGSA